MPRRLRMSLAALAISAAGVYLLFLVGMFALQRQLLFVPTPGPTDPVEAGLTGYALAHFRTADGLAMPYWEHRHADPGSPLVLYFHGNGGGLHGFTPALRRLAEQGFAVAAMEYRGYPGAPGAPSEAHLVADAKVLAQTLAQREPARPLVIWGYSLGSGVATLLASDLAQERVLVLEAPFTAARDLAKERYPMLPVSWLMRDPFDSLSRVASVGAAVFMMHGERDHVIPSAHSERLFAAARQPKQRIAFPEAGHFDLHEAGGYAAAFAFIAEHAMPGNGP